LAKNSGRSGGSNQKRDGEIMAYDATITKFFFLSTAGLLAEAKLFGFLTNLYRALVNKEGNVWNSVSFSQVVKVVIFISCILMISKKPNERNTLT
jgi:hypothetical protein